jgi:thiamine-monophosphate kinase
MSDKEVTLLDLGERRILREIIPRYVETAGDDCASLLLRSPQLVITTDPVPRPAADVIGHDADPYWVGWLLVTINASDIAASGAYPEGFVAALDLPREYPVRKFERLLQGISDSCEANSLQYAGGNIRESSHISAVGSAVGSCQSAPLTRRGASDGDYVVILGTGGRFWHDALLVRSGKKVDKKKSPLFSPIAQARVMHELHQAKLIKCAMDTSDGLAPTLEELSTVNHLTIEVDVAAMRKASAFGHSVDRPERLWFGWGDWTIVLGVSKASTAPLGKLAQKLGAPVTTIGRFRKGDVGVILIDGERRIRAGRLESERFARDSWFTEGINEYIRRLEGYPLP